MTRTAGAQIGCQRPSRFWGLGRPKIYHEAEDTLAGVLRLSLDTKATVKVGPFSRGGKSRCPQPACDHDFDSKCT
ncbi:hypothetical protein, partial [Thiolapillus sp.]|uniref:hypothetical protein n=1 Tax=Thiolapillus sp. TaxID=2017437 RepID=UPI003AF54955